MITSSSTHHKAAQLASAYAQIDSDIASVSKHGKATRGAYDALQKSCDSVMCSPDHKTYSPSANGTASIEDTQVPTDIQQEKRYYLATFHEMEHSKDATTHDHWLQQIDSYQEDPHALQTVVQDFRMKSALALTSHANTLLAYERLHSRIHHLAAGVHTSKSDSGLKIPCDVLMSAEGAKDTEDILDEVESAKKVRQKMSAATHRDSRLALTALASISQEEASTNSTHHCIDATHHKLLQDMRAAAEVCSSITRFWHAAPNPMLRALATVGRRQSRTKAGGHVSLSSTMRLKPDTGLAGSMEHSRNTSEDGTLPLPDPSFWAMGFLSDFGPDIKGGRALAWIHAI